MWNMMLNKILANKKIVIATITLLLALCVGIIIFVASNTKDNGGKNIDTETEQSKEEENSKDEADANDKEDGESGLEVLKPDEVSPENSSDTLGSWDNTSDSGTQSGNTNTNVNTDKTDDQNQDSNSNDSDEGDGEEPEKDEDILEDDITWGNIY